MDESALLQARHKASLTKVQFGDVWLTIRRPTDLEASEMQYYSVREAVRGIAKFVENWEGVTELDIAPGGSDSPAKFTDKLFVAWLDDQPEIWSPLIDKTKGLYEQYRQKKEDSKKN